MKRNELFKRAAIDAGLDVTKDFFFFVLLRYCKSRRVKKSI